MNYFVLRYAGFGTLFHKHKKSGEGNQRYGKESE